MRFAEHRLWGLVFGGILVALTLSACNIIPGQTQAASSVQETEAGQTYILSDAEIYTLNSKQPWAEAVAIEDGIIKAVGSEAEVRGAVASKTPVIDLGGKMLMPGFQDAHLHAIEAGMNEGDLFCVLPETASAKRYQKAIRACAKAQKDEPWVRAAGVSMADLLEDEAIWPVELLDKAVPDRPVLILDNLGHGAWANSLALDAVGYSDLDSDPPGGILDRDPDTGELSGVVFENAQQKLRTASLPPTPKNLDRAYEGLLAALEILAKNGITSVSDAGGYWPRGQQEIWQRAEQEETLTVRASNALYVFPDRPLKQQLRDLEQRFSDDSEQLVRFNQAKIYTDGILSQGSGALYEPYEASLELGFPEDGFLYFEPELLNRYVQALDAMGFQIHFHATGDRGAGLALDAIEAAQQRNGNSDLRHRITHLYLVAPKDRPRFKELDVIADFQYSADAIDPDYADDMGEFIGARADQLLPGRSMLDSGATVVLSSDWDADELSPFEKLQAVISRGVETIPDRETALRMMTLDVAYLLHQEATTGSIEPGKFADLIVVDRNLLEVPTQYLGKTQVLLTLLEGEPVYDPTGILD